ncbi:hypothetical protein ABIF86_000389 [Bradyrhizobium japonicum]
MTNTAKQLRISRFLQVSDEAATEKGLKISIGFDFHEYIAIARLTPTKSPTFPSFRPDRSPIKPGEGYWIMGVDKDNDVALVKAVRLYDLSHSNFGDHLQSLKVFYGDPSMHAHPQDNCTCTAPSAYKITGKVAYEGDLWLRRDLRGRGIVRIAAGITRRLTFAMWAPDFSCALVAGWTLEKAVYEVPHYEPGGAILQLVEDNIAEDNWLVWRTGEELKSEVERQERSSGLAF